ncbi:hypothetical protein BAUCODRAFT_216246 [Baudoinia panamericana UAMH 10762]|uniref:Coenzyme Q-binding protein COQ10 START domain-containing protein n=1 Tax=Baudoinia panamericana (strain UAMH 10762) TaxID=717646 RepID=M2MBU0_BAUPA|nr:uncharacterized protein BAUCODRAFT_216246 [Baudoinia panamericana UAMH 10762]EMC93961.1 hypothetical protein BAUCODRAFT_216246 [Baudoinia panamericana UAMH 10762]
MAPPHLLEGDAFRDANNTGPRRSHYLENGGVFSIYADTKINAPPKAVYDAILDIEKWKDWNSFVFDVKVTSHPHSHHRALRMEEGTNMIFSVRMTEDDRTTSKEQCTHVGPLRTLADHDPPALTHIRWSLHNAALMAPGFVIKAERTNELEDVGDGTTIYRTWQTFGGMFANSVKKKYEQALKDRFQDWCRDLKAYVEGKQMNA